MQSPVIPLNSEWADPDFGISVNPIPTRGADYAHHITIRSPFDLQTFLRPLDVPSNLRRGHFVSTAAAAHKKTRPLTVEPEFK